MKTIPFSDMINKEIFFRNIIAMHQSGNGLYEFNYTKIPRPNSGILFVQTPGLIYTLPDGNTLIPKKGEILYLPEGSHYSVRFENENARTMLVNFNLKDNLSNSVVASENLFFYPSKNEYEALFFEICDIYTNKVENKLLLNSSLYRLFNFLAMEEEKKTPISAAVDYINNHLTEKFSIHDLAKHSAMSESTFRREFKRETGTSPLKYITGEKIKKAGQLICFSDLSINEISLNLGFFDAAHFCKTFKEFYKKTPAQYKKDYHKGEF